MHYENMVEARFVSRPNRFIAYCEYDGAVIAAHVRNTGRCRELLIPGVKVSLEKSSAPHRKTLFSLVGVVKNGRWVNIDSMAPNRIFREALELNPRLLGDLGSVTHIRPEARFENSRFDFYLETAVKKAFVEVKGVTLEVDGRVLFPDAPTQRGIRHLEELMLAKMQGFDAYVVFIAQMKGILSFSPNLRTHPEFGDALKKAHDAGVGILCYDCFVDSQTIVLGDPVHVIL